MIHVNNDLIVEQIQKNAIRLDNNDDLDVLIEAVGDANYVLLGEASHGTSEFYTLRAELSKKLIEKKGFSFIAVEGDWPSCYGINRYVKNYLDAGQDIHHVMEQEFKRWPTWMWANQEIIELAGWLKEHNSQLPKERKIGFYGLDVYSLWESMEEVIRYLEKINSPDLEKAKKAFSCFEPFGRDAQNYGVSAAFLGEGCQDEVVQLLQALQANRMQFKEDHEAALSTELNALVTVNAERYYRSMVRGGNDSWNIRDRHMVEVLNQLMKFHGSDAKVIVWEHNTHIGDARATDMAEDGMVNVGQLVREQHGHEQTYAVGFGTYSGTVIAARGWGESIEEMVVPAAIPNSWENLLHQAGNHDKILLFNNEQINTLFGQEIGHRAIGVVYNPEYERFGNYVPSKMSQRYDAFIYVDKSEALHPLVLREILV
nr:erythromycin esterase family protein [Aneurinibacillus tyrosinisolvens]